MADNQVGNSISGLLSLAVGAGTFVFVAIPAFMGCGSQTSPINADIMRPDAWAWWMGSNVCRSGKSLHEAFKGSVKPGGSAEVTLPDGTPTSLEPATKNDVDVRELFKRIEPKKPVIQQRGLGDTQDQQTFKSFEDM
jgi:hypothetical protein